MGSFDRISELYFILGGSRNLSLFNFENINDDHVSIASPHLKVEIINNQAYKDLVSRNHMVFCYGIICYGREKWYLLSSGFCPYYGCM